VAPVRVLDTRNDPDGAIDGETGIDLEVAGVFPVGADAQAVVANVTATQAQNGGHLTVWPGDVPPPEASNVNFVPNQDVPNLVIVPIAADGFISIITNTGPVHVIVDIVGAYYDWPDANGPVFTPLPPARILVTRDGTGETSPGYPDGILQVQVGGKGGVPSTASAVVMNVTVTGGTASSNLTVYPGDAWPPSASNLNFKPNEDIANLVMVKLAGGQVRVRNVNGSVDVIFDVVGWFS
jgi:hypothetical protein